MMPWHRIDDPNTPPPMDGTPFQAWMTDGRSGRSVEQCWEPYARYNKDGSFQIWGRIDYDQEGYTTDFNPEWHPTHWQPFPPPPETDT